LVSFLNNAEKPITCLWGGLRQRNNPPNNRRTTVSQNPQHVP
jgi:hypothetical protein